MKKLMIGVIDDIVADYEDYDTAKQVYIDYYLDILDTFAKSKGFVDIFHLAGNETTFEDESGEINNTIDFIKKYKDEFVRSSIESSEELLDLIAQELEKNPNLSTIQILNNFFDKVRLR